MGLFSGGSSPDFLQTDIRALARDFAPGIRRMSRSLARNQLMEANLVQRGAMSPTDLPEFAKMMQVQRTTADRSLSEIADKLIGMQVSGPAAAAVLNRAREGRDASTLALAGGMGDIMRGKAAQGIQMGQQYEGMGLQAAGMQGQANAALNQVMAQQAATEQSGTNALLGALGNMASGAFSAFI